MSEQEKMLAKSAIIHLRTFGFCFTGNKNIAELVNKTVKKSTIKICEDNIYQINL